MALINCEECGKEISNKAKHCVNCGAPISQDVEFIPPSSPDYKSIDENINRGYILNTISGFVDFGIVLFRVVNTLAYIGIAYLIFIATKNEVLSDDIFYILLSVILIIIQLSAPLYAVRITQKNDAMSAKLLLFLYMVFNMFMSYFLYSGGRSLYSSDSDFFFKITIYFAVDAIFAIFIFIVYKQTTKNI